MFVSCFVELSAKYSQHNNVSLRLAHIASDWHVEHGQVRVSCLAVVWVVFVPLIPRAVPKRWLDSRVLFPYTHPTSCGMSNIFLALGQKYLRKQRGEKKYKGGISNHPTGNAGHNRKLFVQ